ncbi:hypothetical protein [Jiangella alkaliphila]|uniref:Uncharacterized protein n=1 Tax=Jiangella alkaliphila TaxID=419479 RepID=A0A1H2L9Q1_9ACTN|nr:hypothetical protein [Jiangella alkaliphila]SDU77186.1 hypothetical protein SAMN04488563_5449 [Jiangella alkaliphila]
MSAAVEIAIAQRRCAYTRERLMRARNELRALAPGTPWIPDAALAQADFEFELFATRAYGISPQSTEADGSAALHVFGLIRISPRSDALVVSVADATLPDLIRRFLPAYRPSDPEVGGAPGLRPVEVGHRQIALGRLDRPGRLIIEGTAPARWRRCLAGWTDELDAAGYLALWRTSPERLHPRELRQLRLFDSLYTRYGSHRRQVARLISGLIRRNAVFHYGAPSTCVDMWINPALDGAEIHIEWFDGPDHTTVIDLLTAPRCGLPLRVFDGGSSRLSPTYSIGLKAIDDPGVRLFLRHQVTVPGDKP